MPDLPVPRTTTDVYLAAIHQELQKANAGRARDEEPAPSGGRVELTEPAPQQPSKRTRVRRNREP